MPPCDLPWVPKADRRGRSSRSKVKRTEAEKALDAAQQLNLQQYGKQRYAVPREVHAASLSGIAPATTEPEVVLRLNFEAFAVHLRHQHCLDFVACTQGPECSLVRRLLSSSPSFVPCRAARADCLL